MAVGFVAVVVAAGTADAADSAVAADTAVVAGTADTTDSAVAAETTVAAGTAGTAEGANTAVIGSIATAAVRKHHWAASGRLSSSHK